MGIGNPTHCMESSLNSNLDSTKSYFLISHANSSKKYPHATLTNPLTQYILINIYYKRN